jgi:hypothetical protein
MEREEMDKMEKMERDFKKIFCEKILFKKIVFLILFPKFRL